MELVEYKLNKHHEKGKIIDWLYVSLGFKFAIRVIEKNLWKESNGLMTTLIIQSICFRRKKREEENVFCLSIIFSNLKLIFSHIFKWIVLKILILLDLSLKKYVILYKYCIRMNWHYVHQDSFKLLRKKIIKENLNLAGFFNFIFLLDLLLLFFFGLL